MKKKETIEVISRFTGKYAFLDNSFVGHEFTYEGNKFNSADATYTWTLEDLEEAEEILMEAMKTSGKPEDYRMSLWGVGRKIDRMKNFQ